MCSIKFMEQISLSKSWDFSPFWDLWDTQPSVAENPCVGRPLNPVIWPIVTTGWIGWIGWCRWGATRATGPQLFFLAKKGTWTNMDAWWFDHNLGTMGASGCIPDASLRDPHRMGQQAAAFSDKQSHEWAMNELSSSPIDQFYPLENHNYWK